MYICISNSSYKKYIDSPSSVLLTWCTTALQWPSCLKQTDSTSQRQPSSIRQLVRRMILLSQGSDCRECWSMTGRRIGSTGEVIGVVKGVVKGVMRGEERGVVRGVGINTLNAICYTYSRRQKNTIRYRV
jgi:hypothetical protein